MFEFPPKKLRLESVVEYWAERKPNSLALEYQRAPHEGTTVSWRELNAGARLSSSHLMARGLSGGDVCGLLMEDHPNIHRIIFGILRAGGVVVPIDRTWGVATTNSIIRHCRPKFIVGIDPVAWSRELDVDTSGTILLDDLQLLAAAKFDTESVPRSHANQLALIAYTSGTTSGPKGVMLTHANLRAAYQNGRDGMDLVHVARFGCVFRLSTLGILGIHYFLAQECGATSVILPELNIETARHFMATCNAHQIGFVYLVPSLVALLTKLGRIDRTSLPSTLFVSAGAPLSQALMDEFQERFGVTLLNIYGLTEASFAVFFGARNSLGHGTVSIGQGKYVEARVVDSEGIVLGQSSKGELQIRGQTVSQGYLNNSRANSELFDGDWLRTGDIVRCDEDGNYCVVGRIKDIAIRGGINIHLQEVDEVISRHPSVLAACAVGIPNRISGEEIFVGVVLLQTDDVSEEQLLDWCREDLGPARYPRRIVFLDELSYTSTGKLIRAEVRKRILHEIERDT